MYYLGICMIYLNADIFIFFIVYVIKHIANIFTYYLDIKAKENVNGSLQQRSANIKELHVTFA